MEQRVIFRRIVVPKKIRSPGDRRNNNATIARETARRVAALGI
jgi:hypothetical protein